MEIYFGTVVRTAPLEKGGEIVKLDWDNKKILARHPIFPGEPDLSADPNPRGRSRGCRGIEIAGDKIVAANYHSLEIFDNNLNKTDTVSHQLMVGLHEIHHTRNQKVWVSSTAIDAAFCIDISSGQCIEQFWPREMDVFQKTFDISPLKINKNDDNRDKFLNIQPKKDKNHLHLNAVTEHNGEIYALFNKYGAIVNLTRKEVVLQDKKIIGAHNIVFADDHTIITNESFHGGTLIFDLRSQKMVRRLNLKRYPVVFRHIFKHYFGYTLDYFLRGTKIKTSPIVAKPLFVRGLQKSGDLLFVGISPAMILCFDLKTYKLVDHFTYSKDLKVTIHGLKVCE